MSLAPVDHCNRVDPFVLRPFDEVHPAPLTHQVAGKTQCSFPRRAGAGDRIPIQPRIEIVSCPTHGRFLLPPPARRAMKGKSERRAALPVRASWEVSHFGFAGGSAI